MERGDGQGAHLESDEQIGVDGPAKRIGGWPRARSSGRGEADGQQKADAVSLEPPGDETQESRGRGIQPLKVVDRHEHRGVTRQGSNER